MSGERALVNEPAMFSRGCAVLIKQDSPGLISITLFSFSLVAAILLFLSCSR